MGEGSYPQGIAEGRLQIADFEIGGSGTEL
jgi:hypothetical protein